MAKNYNDIYTAVYTKGNKMDFGNSMIRGNGFVPLVFNSFKPFFCFIISSFFFD